MKDLLTYILTAMVDHPEDLVVTETTEEDIIRFNVQLNQEDYPRVIGKQGLTIKAITDIVRAAKFEEASTHKVYINIES